MNGKGHFTPLFEKSVEPVSVMGPVGFEPTTKRL